MDRSRFPTFRFSSIRAKRAEKSGREFCLHFCRFECLSLSMIMLVSALMCAHRKLPPSDAGGLQLSNLVASIGQHPIPARSSQEMGPLKPP